MVDTTTEITFDDGDALCENVWINGHLIGRIWTDGEGCGYQARATSNISGYWTSMTTAFETRTSALRALTAQARFEREPYLLSDETYEL